MTRQGFNARFLSHRPNGWDGLITLSQKTGPSPDRVIATEIEARSWWRFCRPGLELDVKVGVFAGLCDGVDFAATILNGLPLRACRSAIDINCPGGPFGTDLVTLVGTLFFVRVTAAFLGGETCALPE